MRAWCHMPLVHSLTPMTAVTPAVLPACGWRWCADKDSLTPEHWADLRAAVEILRERGCDPNGRPVAYQASMYAGLRQREKAWPEAKAAVLAAVFLDTVPQDVDVHRLTALRVEEATLRWAAAPRRVRGGNPIDKPYQVFLNNVNAGGGTPAVAAAILFLFGVGKKGARLDKETHRAEVAWRRGGKLNVRQKPTHSQMT
jgi:hypothetical protein